MVENSELYQKYFDLAFKDSPVFRDKKWQKKYREVTADFVSTDNQMGASDQIGYLPEMSDRPEVAQAGLQAPMLRIERFNGDYSLNTSMYGRTIVDFISPHNATSFFVLNYYYLDSQGRSVKVEEVADTRERKEDVIAESLSQTTETDVLLEESTRCVVLTMDDENYLKTLLKRIEGGEFEVTTYFGVRKIGSRVDEWSAE